MATTNQLVSIESKLSRLSDQLIPLLISTGSEDEEKRSRLQTAFDKVSDELCEALSDPELIPVTDVCQLGKQAILHTCSSTQAITQAQYDFISRWPLVLHSLISSPDDEQSIQSAIEFLKSRQLHEPLSDQDAEMLTALFEAEKADATQSTDETYLTHETENKPDPDHIEEINIIELKPVNTTTNHIHSISDKTNSDNSYEYQSVSAQKMPAKYETKPLTDAQRTLIEVMKLELSQIIEPIKSYIEQAINPDSEVRIIREIFSDYAELVTRVSTGFEAMGLSAFYFVCDILATNLRELAEDAKQIDADSAHKLLLWPDLMSDCLCKWGSSNSCELLAKHLQDPFWPIQLSDEEIQSITESLLSSEIQIDEEDIEQRQTVASDEDISLDIPADVNFELFDSLLIELPSQASDFSRALQKAISGRFISDLEEAMRIAHTIKGAANTVGVSGLANLSHQIEDILEAYTKASTIPAGDICETLMQASDCLEAMTESLTSLSPQPSDSVEVLQSLLDWANYIDQNGIPSANTALETTSSNTEQPDNESTESYTTEPEKDKVTPMLRVPATVIDNLLKIVGESIILTGQVQDKLKRTIEETNAVKEQNKRLSQLSNELEQLVDIQQHKLYVSDAAQNNDFDALEMAQYSELHTCAHRLIEAVMDETELHNTIDGNLRHLDQILLDQHQLNLDAQENVLKTRMVSVNTILSRLQRSVRQAARLTKKKVNFKISGSETPVDSDVINQLVDPLMHILRNAVDHGVETTEDRLENGKSETATINLDFSREGNMIVVACRDDGRGFDLRAIQNKAIEKGLISENHSLAKEDILQLILHPGFSTTESTNQLSGRGIGMDIVNSKIQQLKGTLKLDCAENHGSLVELRIPVTLLSTHALLARCGSTRIAISNRGIQQIIYPGAGIFQNQNDLLTYQIDDQIYLAHNLDQLIDNEEDINSKSFDKKTALLVEDNLEKRIVMVDEVLDTRDLVVKDTGQFVMKQEGIVGATILGDGSITPVIDIPDLLRVNNSTGYVSNNEHAFTTTAKPIRSLPKIVVADDSLSARKSLVQFVQELGYEPISAKDGLEAVELLNQHEAIMLITDLEMPRMNGLELSSHIRTTASINDLPIIMITSRSSEKHKNMALKAGVDVYLTKPYSEDTLLNQIESLLITTDA